MKEKAKKPKSNSRRLEPCGDTMVTRLLCSRQRAMYDTTGVGWIGSGNERASGNECNWARGANIWASGASTIELAAAAL